jgi:CRP/FNR family transcriptional regulator, cyclic AMP receptor protein
MASSNVVPLYSNSVIFGALATAEQRALLATARPCHYEREETIFMQGEPGDWMLLIDSGSVEISITAADGRKSVLNQLEAGSIVGEIALLDRQGRSANAVATTPVTGTRVSRHAVLEFLSKHNDACLAIIETLCARVRNASDMFETRALTSASARLARCLLRFAGKWGTAGKHHSVLIDQPISQTLLGEFAGIARENVNRYIQSWSQDGVLLYKKNGITILDMQRLKELAEY